MGDTGPFSINEKVLVPHTDKFYEAKVQKAQKRDDGLWYYFLHYTGWNKKWDEWVEETGLRRASASGAAAAAAAPTGGGNIPPAAAAAAAAAAGGSVGAAAALAPGSFPGAATGGPSKQKKQHRKQAAAATSGDAVGAVVAGGGVGVSAVEPAESQLQIELPASLKKQLLDQYDAIHDDNKLLQLPRRPNVLQIFQQYVQYVRDKQGGSQAEDDLVAGLQVYFDKALYQCLLFKAERRQADQLLASGQVPSSIYGAEHLMRLIVKLPELLPHTGATAEALQLLMKRLEDLMTYMQVQASRIFSPVSEYQSADAVYGAAVSKR